MGCGVRSLQGLGIKAVLYEFLVLKISDLLFLQGDDNIYSTIWSPNKTTQYFCHKPFPSSKGKFARNLITPEPFKGGGTKNQT